MYDYGVMGDSLLQAIVVLIVGIVSLRAFREFSSDSQVMSIRFRLFALRDELSLLAVKGQIQQDSASYTFIRDIINGSIGSCERLDFVFFVKAISRELSEETRAEHKKVISDIYDKPELIRIYAHTLKLILESFEHNSLILKLLGYIGHVSSNDMNNQARRSQEMARHMLKDIENEWPTAACA